LRLAQGRVAIIGAGFIACEFANDLCLSGHQVLVVVPNALPLSSVLPASINQELKNALEADGVEFSLSTSISILSNAVHLSLN
jgi:rubredoxin---NAD+ reductase